MKQVFRLEPKEITRALMDYVLQKNNLPNGRYAADPDFSYKGGYITHVDIVMEKLDE